MLEQRNSHWRVQSFVGHPQAVKNDPGLVSTFPGRFDENNVITPTMHTSPQDPVESEPSSCKLMDQQQPELINKATVIPMPLPVSMGAPPVQGDGVFSHPLQRPVSDTTESADCPITSEALNQHEDLTIEGGTINISSVYSQGSVIITAFTDLFCMFFAKTTHFFFC